MYCMYCGTELVNGACPKCEGTSTQSSTAYVYPRQIKRREPTSARVFSIVAIATSVLGLLGYSFPYLSIAAIVFSLLYKSKMGAHTTLTRTAKILGIVGLIVNTVILAVTAIVSAIVAVVGAVISFSWAIVFIFQYIEEFYNIIMQYASYFM